MRRVGQIRKRDTVETPIRQALAAVGATVFQVSGKGAPDVIVFYRGYVYSAEIKTGKGKLTAAQTEAGAGRLWAIWRTVDDALKGIGAQK